MKRAALLLALSLSLGLGFRPAVAADDGGTTSPFNLGAGARELALGGASMATSEPTTAAFWNAARLAGTERLALTALHSRLIESGVSYQYFGLALPTLDYGCFGLGIFRHSVSGIDKRDAGNLSLGDIGLNQFRVYAAYGRSFGDYDAGLALFVEHHSLDLYKATSSPGVNLAVSRAFDLPSEVFPRVTVAVNGINLIQPGLRMADETYSDPRAVTAGAALDVQPASSPLHRLMLSASYSKTDNVAPSLRLGLEYNTLEMLHVRGGLQGGRPAFGAGLSYGSVAFDYALVDREFGSIHMFNLTTAFGLPVDERRVRRARQREQEFDRLMQDRFLEKNRTLLEVMVAEGTEHLRQHRFDEALGSLEGALLLARSTDSDTLRITSLLAEARDAYETVTRTARYFASLDSATVKVAQGDYLAGRYFANLALGIDPESDSARALLAAADRALAGSIESRRLLLARVAEVDTLIAQGRLDQAGAVVQTLVEFAPEDDAVRLATMQVEMARLRRALATGGRADGQEPADGRAGARRPPPSPDRPVADAGTKDTVHALPGEGGADLSPELQREVETTYRAAQEAFGAGDVQQAIAGWEKVERLAPDHLSVRDYLVRAYKFVGVELYTQKQRAQAVAVWQKAAALAPGDEELRDYIHHTQTEIEKLRKLSYDEP